MHNAVRFYPVAVLTVVLNGVTVIDHQPIDTPASGAIHTDASAPGPICLQGDHTAVK